MDDYDGGNDHILPAGEPLQENEVSKKIKFVLIAFSMFFWFIGALFCAIGGYVISQSIGYRELSDFAMDPGVIITLLGLYVFIISSFGVLGALRENIRLLKYYKILLLAALFLEVFTAFVGFAFWPEVKKLIDKGLQVAIDNYTVNTDLRNMIDMIQRQLKCCGSLTIDDWDSNPYFSCAMKESFRSCGVPWSCCHTKFQRNRQCGYGMRRNRAHFNLGSELHIIGCLDKGFEFFRNNMGVIAALCITFTIPLIAAIFLLHVFIKQIQRQIGINAGFLKPEKTAMQ